VTKPIFLELDGAAIAQMRQDTNVSIIIDWLVYERGISAEKTVQYLGKGDDANAKAHATASRILDHIIARLKTPAPLGEFDDEEVFSDPAQRPTRKVKTDAEA